jgi:predicted transcriptional regulator
MKSLILFIAPEQIKPMMQNREKIIEHATDIIASYVSNNEVLQADLPKLIQDVLAALINAVEGKSVADLAAPVLRQVSSIKKSVFPDYLICLEDGKRFKSLKRHLRSAYNLTPEKYREKWKLPADYPMVAPNYATTRSNLAKSSGLGKKAAKKK